MAQENKSLRRFGAKSLRRFGAKSLRRFGAKSLRRFGGSLQLFVLFPSQQIVTYYEQMEVCIVLAQIKQENSRKQNSWFANCIFIKLNTHFVATSKLKMISEARTPLVKKTLTVKFPCDDFPGKMFRLCVLIQQLLIIFPW